jgi:hypothetical protein
MDSQAQRTIVIFALVAALGVLSVQAVDLVLFLQAEAAPGCEKGLPNSAPGVNASKGRCFKG